MREIFNRLYNENVTKLISRINWLNKKLINLIHVVFFRNDIHIARKTKYTEE